MQNNPSSFDERSSSNQRVAAAESINVSVESSDNVSIECSDSVAIECTDSVLVECTDKMPIECSEPPQEMAQPLIGLIIEEVPQNSESVNLEENSAQASRASNPFVQAFHLSQSIRDDSMSERFDTFSCCPSPQHRADMAMAMPTCRTNMTSLIDEEVVEEVLAFGFQWNDVEVAVARLLSCRCADEITVIEILKYLFQNEKETEIQHVPKMEPCMVCHLEDPNILFLPCCHICCCQSCGESCYLCSYCHCHIKAKKKIYIP